MAVEHEALEMDPAAFLGEDDGAAGLVLGD
jgi:hypothetical protein